MIVRALQNHGSQTLLIIIIREYGVMQSRLPICIRKNKGWRQAAITFHAAFQVVVCIPIAETLASTTAGTANCQIRGTQRHASFPMGLDGLDDACNYYRRRLVVPNGWPREILLTCHQTNAILFRQNIATNLVMSIPYQPYL